MHTMRVDICYRPLRIGLAIRSYDIDAFRQAVCSSHTLWGGRFNPILLVDQEEEANRLIDLFRIDLILLIGNTKEVTDFPKKYPHLIKPFFFDTLWVGNGTDKRAQALDVHNALVHIRDKPEWKAIKDKGVQLYTWREDDPLVNVFFMQLGAYPSVEETGINYRNLLAQAAGATEHALEPEAVITADVLDHPNIAYMSRYGLKRHYTKAC